MGDGGQDSPSDAHVLGVERVPRATCPRVSCDTYIKGAAPQDEHCQADHNHPPASRRPRSLALATNGYETRIMHGMSVLKCFCASLCVIILVAEVVTAAPSYPDYENSIRDLYELMMQKEALEERLGHQIVRKSSRSPSLRLRFGRRSDPNMLSIPPFLLPNSGEPERLEN